VGRPVKPALRDTAGLPGTVTLTSWTPPGGLAYDEWVASGRLLGKINRALNWWIAAWVLYGEGHFGERFAQALDDTGLAPQTLQNVLTVARAFPESRRRETLTFAHHAELASLDADAQDRWLDQAEAGDQLPNGERQPWSVKRLREARSERRPAPTGCAHVCPWHPKETR